MIHQTSIVLALATLGTATADMIHVPGDAPSIQEAIDSATTGDVVLVAPGTWTESIDTLGKSITIEGEGMAVEVVLRSPDGGSILHLDDQESMTTFRNLTFTGGSSDAVVRVAGASPLFERCVFRDNQHTAVADSDACGNTTGATFVGCLFMDNRSVNAGAMYLSHSNSVLEACAFVGNVVSGQPSPFVSAGAAIYVNNWECGVNGFTIRNCDFIDNSAVWGGGIYAQGIYPSASTDLVVEGCRFVGNTASEGRSMWLWYIDGDVSDTYFCGGGDQIHNGWGDLGGNVFVEDCAGAEISDCDGDRVPDALAISLGLAVDCDGDGRPDTCSAGNPKTDADGNGIPDICEIEPCPADLSGNGAVDGGDLGIWLSLAGNDCQTDPTCPADVNGDGVSDGADLGDILAAWGPCPE